MNSTLINYISDQRKRGAMDEQLEATLKDSGWAIDDIKEAMRAIDKPPQMLRLLSAPNLLTKALRLYRRSFFKLLLLSFLTTLLIEFFRRATDIQASFILLVQTSLNSSLGALQLIGVLIGLLAMCSILGLLFNMLVQTAISPIKLSLAEAFKKTWKNSAGVFLILLLSAIILTVGTYAFLIPGIIFLVWYGFTPLIRTQEGNHGIKSFNFSRRLTQKNFFGVLWRYIFIALIISALTYILSLIVDGLSYVLVAKFNNIIYYRGFIKAILSGALLGPLFIAYSYLLYANLSAMNSQATSKKWLDYTIIIISVFLFVWAVAGAVLTK